MLPCWPSRPFTTAAFLIAATSVTVALTIVKALPLVVTILQLLPATVGSKGIITVPMVVAEMVQVHHTTAVPLLCSLLPSHRYHSFHHPQPYRRAWWIFINVSWMCCVACLWQVFIDAPLGKWWGQQGRKRAASDQSARDNEGGGGGSVAMKEPLSSDESLSSKEKEGSVSGSIREPCSSGRF